MTKLATLRGTVKQLVWAEKIRSEYAAKNPGCKHLLRRLDAQWWINNRVSIDAWKYDPDRKATGADPILAAIPACTYLLIDKLGRIYTGATTNIKRRLREHNSSGNRGYTRGTYWHLLAVKHFPTRTEAFAFERKVKRGGAARRRWLSEAHTRREAIALRFGYTFS
ncbi:GIY-YIG nuclease family protein [Duganella sp. FT134W]|uniref:GIY-YIG nuclease family protein n=1 Tax=Duganella margarita TaxID=2692170 RepID=A0A7X4GZA0_9BURK|nr:GIY-YIG nuclease family protein [Duganella margarita]